MKASGSPINRMGRIAPFLWMDPKKRTMIATIEMVIIAYMDGMS
jgi:hypothetical protein